MFWMHSFLRMQFRSHTSRKRMGWESAVEAFDDGVFTGSTPGNYFSPLLSLLQSTLPNLTSLSMAVSSKIISDKGSRVTKA
jgi:hypothetical protein